MTRLSICTRECEFIHDDGVGNVACERMCDDRGRPVPCLLKRALRTKSQSCPHPDPEFARRWNEAETETDSGCGGASPAVVLRAGELDFLTLRVRQCLVCPEHGRGWHCGREGFDIRELLRDPNYSCKAGRFAAIGGAA